MPQTIEEEGQRREYSRVEAYIPFEYRIVAPEERDYIQSRISGYASFTDFKPRGEMGDQDNILAEWMKIINLKLDTVIRLLTLQREGYFGLSYRAVNISGGGISFCQPTATPLGNIMEVKLVFPLNQSVALCIYGEVIKVEQRHDHYFTALRYVHMDDLVRNEIVRFVFEREREIIREKRG
jgi:c-di-GMP-binding flagellar brake protein YcgR